MSRTPADRMDSFGQKHWLHAKSGVSVTQSRPRRWKRCLVLALALPAILISAGLGAVTQETNLATATVIATPAMPQPGYLEPAVDPVFRTRFTRVTDPGKPHKSGVVCDRAYCTHRYSSAQAWNADQSLLLIANGCNGACFLDGQTYQPLFSRRMPSACEWHPRDATLMICVHSNRILTWAPRSNTIRPVWESGDYSGFEFGPGAGNPSFDGNRVAVRARDKAGARVVFAVDIAAKQKFPDIRLADLQGENSYATISPSGRYIFLFQELKNGVEQGYVYTVGGEQIQHWTDHHRPGHGDMTIDADGHDVYVGVSKSDPDKYHIIKRRLIDGEVTDLAPYGDGNHVSARNINLPGWVFVSYSSRYFQTVGRTGWAPFYQEVVALKIDGSGEIRRIAQNRNALHDYWSETHASPSPDGTQVIWSSNWGRAGGPVADYVTRLSWPDDPPRDQMSNSQSENRNAKRNTFN